MSLCGAFRIKSREAGVHQGFPLMLSIKALD
jgi:hypothetical protein